jgi:uncharacterized delta-60 repeat protein
MKRLPWLFLGLMLGASLIWISGVETYLVATANATTAAGALDTTFDPGAGANDIVFAVAQQSDGKVLVGGQFTQFNGAMHNGIARLANDGSLDGSYNSSVTGAGFAGVVSIALQPDGKAVIGGLFSQVNSVARANIARLRTDGALDASFNPGAGVTGTDAYLNAVKLQADGKVLIGGIFTGYNGTPRNNVARLTAGGALDTTFNPGTGADGEVAAIAIQPSDGKVLIGGWFTAVNSTSHNRLARLNTNGSVDSTFNPDVDGSVLAIAVQPDHKILIGGAFTGVNGIARHRIARLNADGTLDTSFDPAAGADKEVDALALQSNGKVVIGGKFTTVGSTERIRMARLRSDGALDISFDSGAGANWTVFAVKLQPDGRVLIGGAFQEVDGVARNHIARLWGDGRLYVPLILRRSR